MGIKMLSIALVVVLTMLSAAVSATFITNDCKGRCTRTAFGGVTCVSLCPPIRFMCLAGMRQTSIKVPIRGTSCSCIRPKCSPILPDLRQHNLKFVGHEVIYNKESKKDFTKLPISSDACAELCATQRQRYGKEWNDVVYIPDEQQCYCVKNGNTIEKRSDSLHYRFVEAV